MVTTRWQGRTSQNARELAHGERLMEIFGSNLPPRTLYARCKQLENIAHRAAEKYCNGDITERQFDVYARTALDNLDAILNFRRRGIPVFVNSDPRGYALKIESEVARDLRIERDMGGYGIIAPDFSED